jgi:transcriptional regulator with XRE-family HTH domain
VSALRRAAVRANTPEMGRELGQRICDLRLALSYTQEDLAERANISVSFLSMIERAQRLPHIDTLASIATALGISLSQLFTGVNGSLNGQQSLLPLIAYLQNLRLGPKDVEALLRVAKGMFKKEP